MSERVVWCGPGRQAVAPVPSVPSGTAGSLHPCPQGCLFSLTPWAPAAIFLLPGPGGARLPLLLSASALCAGWARPPALRQAGRRQPRVEDTSGQAGHIWRERGLLAGSGGSAGCLHGGPAGLGGTATAPSCWAELAPASAGNAPCHHPARPGALPGLPRRFATETGGEQPGASWLGLGWGLVHAWLLPPLATSRTQVLAPGCNGGDPEPLPKGKRGRRAARAGERWVGGRGFPAALPTRSRGTGTAVGYFGVSQRG